MRGQINERCNYKCGYCKFWRLPKYQNEMTIDEWKAGLRSLREFIGRYIIQFDGGEPFLKKGFVDLLQFCSDEGIGTGVITNGSCFTRRTAERVVASQPCNIDISVDSADSGVHDAARGMPGSLQHIEIGIARLREVQARQGIKFPIRIKPTVHALNCETLPDLVEWTQRVGATSIDFQPVRRAWVPSPPEIDTELWIRADRMDAARTIDFRADQDEAGWSPDRDAGELAGANALSFPRRTLRRPYRHAVQVFKSFEYRWTAGSPHAVSTATSVTSGRKEPVKSGTADAARQVREQIATCQRGCAFSCTRLRSRFPIWLVAASCS